MSEIKLLPCPFCGKGFRVNCRGAYEHDNEECLLHGLEIRNAQQMKKWNTRKLMERILTRLGKKEELEVVASVKGSLEEAQLDGYVKGIKKAIETVKKESSFNE